MGPDGAVNIVYRKEIDAAARQGRRAQASSSHEYRAKFANPYKAAELGFIDEVIYPRVTRQRIITRARDAEEQARHEPAEEARQHPALSLTLAGRIEPDLRASAARRHDRGRARCRRDARQARCDSKKNATCTQRLGDRVVASATGSRAR